MNAPESVTLHPRTARLLRELSGDASEEMRRDHEEVAEILRRGRMERSVALANYIATMIAGVVNALRRFAGFESMGSPTA